MKVFFGDNQFLGVNHSAGKGSLYQSKYETAEDIATTLRDAWNVGIRDFSFTVNDKTIRAINIVRADCPFNLHPSFPYAHMINSLILEKGLFGTIFFKIRQFGFFNIFVASIASLFNRNKKLISLLLLSELENLPMENVHSIGLLNIATDFILGSNRTDLLYDFYEVVSSEFHTKPTFYTMNFPMLADVLWGRGFNNCAIVFNYNKSGFRTNPSLEKVRLTINKYSQQESIAMSIFSGSQPDDVENLLLEVPSLSGVVFGSSQKSNIAKNYCMLKKM